ncbi:F0F1 ATP synthase subunit B [Arcanobacterium bovis]|uniref:ATP synthase subunit b n=1 Tax=Arcanobacterium bovis TaxID=2529275 RepID=A0A4Q9UZY0_9ACTO|nr:F0F1 ATP synthase subunit B [Arcanobacterium bovis]TBW21570.1 F0F1 ATP synthase subunit B [Arcanobacterium bovis]
MLESTIIASGGGNPLVPALPDLVWGTLAFVVVALAVYKFAWPSFIATLDERTEKIEKGLQAAEIAREEIAAERVGLQNEVAQAHREAAEIRERAQDNAKSIVTEAQAKAKHEAATLVDSAQQRIAADAQAASRELQSNVGALATELAGRIIGEAVTDSALASRVVDRFLDDLENSLLAKQPTTSREA